MLKCLPTHFCHRFNWEHGHLDVWVRLKYMFDSWSWLSTFMHMNENETVCVCVCVWRWRWCRVAAATVVRACSSVWRCILMHMLRSENLVGSENSKYISIVIIYGVLRLKKYKLLGPIDDAYRCISPSDSSMCASNGSACILHRCYHTNICSKFYHFFRRCISNDSVASKHQWNNESDHYYVREKQGQQRGLPKLYLKRYFFGTFTFHQLNEMNFYVRTDVELTSNEAEVECGKFAFSRKTRSRFVFLSFFAASSGH